MKNFKTKIYTPVDPLTTVQMDKVADFLMSHLQQYGDPKSDILKAIHYALKISDTPGGFVLVAYDNDKIVGSVVINRTGMSGYIPENILVYIAVHNDYRGHGLGKRLMKEALKFCDGGVALHVEPDNPAKFLYEKLGFTNKYLEMRYTKENA